MLSFISFRRNINYLLPRLLIFWKPDKLPRTTNCYDLHAYMPQHQYLAFFVYIIIVYISLYYILKHKISKRNNIYVCDGKHRPKLYNPFLVYCRELGPGTVSFTGDRAQGDDNKHDSHYTSLFIGHNFTTKNYSQPASFVQNVVPCLGSSSRFKTCRLCINSSIKPISQFYSLYERN